MYNRIWVNKQTNIHTFTTEFSEVSKYYVEDLGQLSLKLCSLIQGWLV